MRGQRRSQGRGTWWAMEPGLLSFRLGRELQVSPEGVCGIFSVADIRVPVADTAAADADVLDAVIVLRPPGEVSGRPHLPPDPNPEPTRPRPHQPQAHAAPPTPAPKAPPACSPCG